MSKKKFKMGEQVRCVSELLEHDFFIMHALNVDKTLHAGFVKSWQLQTCEKLIRSGVLYVADRIKGV